MTLVLVYKNQLMYKNQLATKGQSECCVTLHFDSQACHQDCCLYGLAYVCLRLTKQQS